MYLSGLGSSNSSSQPLHLTLKQIYGIFFSFSTFLSILTNQSQSNHSKRQSESYDEYDEEDEDEDDANGDVHPLVWKNTNEFFESWDQQFGSRDVDLQQ
jgi:hypothetical protein